MRCILVILLSVVTVSAGDFTLTEYLGHTWVNERVIFPLSAEQVKQVKAKRALVDDAGREVAWQAVGHSHVALVTDLSPLSTLTFTFAEKSAKPTTDLKVAESAEFIEVTNSRFGIKLHKKLAPSRGPIAGIRLPSGTWTGGSTLAGTPDVKLYSVKVTANGPVFVEVTCNMTFADEGTWEGRFRLDRNEPAIIVNETVDAPGGGTYAVAISGGAFQPSHTLYRGGSGGNLAKLVSKQVPKAGNVHDLTPWLHWWYNENRGPWFALYTPSKPKAGLQAGDADVNDFEQLLERDAAPKPVSKENDMLAAAVLKPSMWKDPRWTGKAKRLPAHIKATAKDGVVSLGFGFAGGQRRWMICGLDKTKSVDMLLGKNRRMAPPPQAYQIKHGDYPLDVVKDYVLEWKGDHDNYPRLFIGKADAVRLREQLEADPAELERWESRQPISKYNLDGPLREYFASGSAKLGSRIVEMTEKSLATVTLEDLLRQNTRASLGVAPHNQAVLLVPTLNISDAALSVPSLSEKQRKLMLAQIAFLGYTVNGDDYWAPKLGLSANPNMTTTVAHYQVATACLIPSHPMAKQWADKGLAELKRQLYNWSDDDGGWLEAPHYAMVSFDHMLASFLMAARAGFGDFVYEDRVKKVVDWFARISTPPNAHTKGLRHLPPIGNTYFNEPTGVFGIMAGLWKERDPEFAGHMQWMDLQHGSPDLGLGWSFPSMAGYKKLLREHGVVPRKPDYDSSMFRKTGVVLRSHYGTERENYLHLIAGSNHAHYDYDSGSIVLWGKGRVLADDWGYIGRHARKYHSLVDGKNAGGNMYVNAFSTQPNLDYVRGKKGAWERQIAFGKDTASDGASFFVLRDTYSAEAGAIWRLWLTAEKVDVIATVGSTVRTVGAVVTGIDDVDMDVFFYNPGNLLVKVETATQKMSVGNRDGKIGPMSMTQTALMTTLPGSGSVVALLFPRMKTEAPPRVVWHADGKIAEVTSKAGTDYVFLATKNEVAGHDDVSFTGTAGAVQLRGKTRILSIGAKGEASWKKDSLKADEAATKVAK